VTQFHNPEHEGLASKAIDPYRLMENERPDSIDPEDFRHWITVYTELADFKMKMLADMVKHLPGMPPVAAAEIRGIDMAIIRRQLARYEGRLAFWERRAGETATRQARRAAEMGAERPNSSQKDVSSQVSY
jgi:hypothetical protein